MSAGKKGRVASNYGRLAGVDPSLANDPNLH